ncbi:MAG: pyruvate formate lyase-activating protein [Clostridiales bacterium]|nr:pyruvate formate lyase-activating protein [Clostridiales bacterium]
MLKGYIHSIETFGAVDGPGIRYIIFLQGCPLRCIFCHNPDSWKLKDGKKVSVNKLVKDIKKYKNYICGVTLSGGEPLMQPKFTLKLIKAIKKLGLTVALDTAGSLPIKTSQKIIDASDLVILDIKGLTEELNKKITGATNKNTLATLDYCEQINKDVWIRQVIVPNYTLDEKYLNELAQFLTKFKCVKSVDLLPFHKLGEHKWKTLNLDYKLYGTPSPTQEQMQLARQVFKKHNLPMVE